jgi:hypothetical protein
MALDALSPLPEAGKGEAKVANPTFALHEKAAAVSLRAAAQR